LLVDLSEVLFDGVDALVDDLGWGGVPRVVAAIKLDEGGVGEKGDGDGLDVVVKDVELGEGLRDAE
jgi:hypothetical protein